MSRIVSDGPAIDAVGYVDGYVYVAHFGKLSGKPSVIFDDTEDARSDHIVIVIFTCAICTPVCIALILEKTVLLKWLPRITKTSSD
jgi:predicted glycosyltransferase